jgi:hypothetical protein
VNTRLSVAALAVCAVSDLAAGPLLLGSDDVPSGVGVGVAVLGLLTLVAAFGISRATRWSRPLAFGTRALDVAAALPALVADNSSAETSAAGITLALSILTMGLLLRHDQHTMHTA